MSSDSPVTVRFRLVDVNGTDIGPYNFHPKTTVLELKEHALANWPRESNRPKSALDLKLILGGRIFDNNKLVSETKVPFGTTEGVTTMHLVIRAAAETKQAEEVAVEKKTKCTCTIL